MTATSTAAITTSPDGCGSTGGGGPKRGYLRQVDLVRIIAFATVVAVHSTSQTVPGSSRGAGMALMLLHCTREVFFLITGFVLIRSYAFRPMKVPSFLRKRITLAGVPYVVWTLIYFGYDEHWHLHGLWLRQLGYELLTGTAFYHLYFLLVTLQAYLLLPLLLKLLRWTQGHHRVVFAISLTLNVLLLQGIVAAQTMHGASYWLANHADPLLVTYQFYLIAGALAAWHLADFQRWVDAHPWEIATCLACAGILAEGTFFLRLHDGAGTASAVLQPAQLPWSVAVALALYAFGSWWADRGPGRISATLVREGSYASFGVYLLHPMVLALLGKHGLRAGHHQILAPTWVTLLAIVLTLAVTTPIVLVLQRTPLSLPLTGRPMRRRVPRSAVPPEGSAIGPSRAVVARATEVVSVRLVDARVPSGTDRAAFKDASTPQPAVISPPIRARPDRSQRRVLIRLTDHIPTAGADVLTTRTGKRHANKTDNPDVTEPVASSRT